MTDCPAFIYKWLSLTDWDKFVEHAEFKGTGLDLKDGYIHASHQEQCLRTYQKFFSNENAVLLRIDTTKLGSAVVKVEASTSGGKYPHVYGTLPLTSVVEYTIKSAAPPNAQ